MLEKSDSKFKKNIFKMQLSGKYNTFWVLFYHPQDVYNGAFAAIFLLL